MALYNFHRVLIAATILFDLFFSLYCLRRYTADDGTSLQLVMLIGSTLAAVGFAAYLIHFNRKVTLMRDVIERSEGSAAADAAPR